MRADLVRVPARSPRSPDSRSLRSHLKIVHTKHEKNSVVVDRGPLFATQVTKYGIENSKWAVI